MVVVKEIGPPAPAEGGILGFARLDDVEAGGIIGEAVEFDAGQRTGMRNEKLGQIAL